MLDTMEQTNEKAKEMRSFMGRLAYYATSVYRRLQSRIEFIVTSRNAGGS